MGGYEEYVQALGYLDLEASEETNQQMLAIESDYMRRRMEAEDEANRLHLQEPLSCLC